MRKDRSDEGRPLTLAAGQLARQHRDACELADAPGQNRVREQSDGEGGEDEQDARVRLRDRLVDHRAPGECARDDGGEVEADREHDPLPPDGGERAADAVEARSAPEEEERNDAEREQNGSCARPGGADEAHAATCS